MNDVEIVPAEPYHAVMLAGCLRAEDAAELAAAGIGPHRGVWRSYRASIYARAALIDGEPAAIWGLGGMPLGRVGQPWLLTAPPVERVKVTFLRVARIELAEMLEVFPRLRGYVDARYHRAIRLLEVLGFTIGEPVGLFREYSLMRGAA